MKNNEFCLFFLLWQIANFKRFSHQPPPPPPSPDAHTRNRKWLTLFAEQFWILIKRAMSSDLDSSSLPAEPRSGLLHLAWVAKSFHIAHNINGLSLGLLLSLSFAYKPEMSVRAWERVTCYFSFCWPVCHHFLKLLFRPACSITCYPLLSFTLNSPLVLFSFSLSLSLLSTFVDISNEYR